MSVYLAIDLGTTGCRSILFDAELNLISECYREYGLITPRELWVEQDANLWWELTMETAKSAIQKAQLPKEEIKGISVSSQGIAIVPVDEQLKPLYNALSWLDMRAKKQAEGIERNFGFRHMFTLTGKPINAGYSLPKILWIKEEMPEIYEKTWKFLMPMDFLIGKLTGQCVTDHSMASGTLMYDIKQKKWSCDILATYQLEGKLPVLKWSGEVAGTILQEVAQELGLSEDCVVAVGAQDQRCASLAAGLSQGVMTLSLGTGGALCKCWNEARTEGDTRIAWSANVNENSWVTEGVINTAASSLRWLRDIMYPGCDYEVINQEALEALTGGSNLLFYPYLNGCGSPDYYVDAAACFYGANLATKRGDFALAVMDAIAFQTRIILEAMDGCKKENTLVSFGGGTKSSIWCQIIADVLDMEVVILNTAEAAGAGAAILAGIATGEFERRKCPRLPYSQTFRPGPRRELYKEKYECYRKMEYKLWR